MGFPFILPAASGQELFLGDGRDIESRHRLAESTECLYLDRGSAGGEFYKLTAVDRHENEGEAVTLGPVGAGGAGAGELEFALHGVQPNPATERNLTVEFTLPDAGPARLTLLDMAGRLVASRDVGAPGAGRQRVNLAEGMKLRAGVYVVRLVQRGRTRTVKAAVVP